MHITTPPDRADGPGRPGRSARHAIRLADGFAGLPEGITRWRLAAALRTAAPRLNLSSTMLRVAELYIDMTHDADWQNGSEPIVCKPLVEIADRLGISERQVRNIERSLVERGLLAWRDSANHHRRGRRDHRTGRLIYAYGPSLAPLGGRAEEILRIADQCRHEIAELRRHRIAIAALRKRVRTELAAGAAEGLDVGDLHRIFEALPTRNPSGTPVQALTEQRHRLLMLTEALARRLDAGAVTTIHNSPHAAESTAKPEISGPHRNKTLTNHSMNGGTAQVANHKARVATAVTDRHYETREGPHVPYSLAEAAAHPTIRSLMNPTDGTGWSTLTEACRLYGHVLGLNPATWTAACGRIGRQAATLCLIITCADDLSPTTPIINRDGYFHALTRKCEEGAINLPKSIRRLARNRGMTPSAHHDQHPLEGLLSDARHWPVRRTTTEAICWT